MDTGSREDTSQAVEVETEIRDNVPDTLDYDGEAITCLSLGVQETAIGQITILGLTAMRSTIIKKNGSIWKN